MTVAVCLPALDEQDQIGTTLAALLPLVASGEVQRVVVFDGGSCDATASIARASGADVVATAELRRDLGPVRGKGDSVWRGLGTVTEDIVVLLDADLIADVAGFARRLVAPLRADPAVAFAKGSFMRLRVDGVTPSDEGGRVSELVARPLLSLLVPEVAHLRVPLSGQVAIRRSVLERIPLATGYGLEIAMLVAVVAAVGIDALREVDLGEARNPPQSLADLGRMAAEVIVGLFRALAATDRLSVPGGSGPTLDALVPPDHPASRAVILRPPLR